jgi:hypothetical protein
VLTSFYLATSTRILGKIVQLGKVVQLPVIWAKNHVIENKQDSKINNCPAVLCGGDEDQQINDQQL